MSIARKTQPCPRGTDLAHAPTPPVTPHKGGLWPYVQIARPDHWFKNVFMVLGLVLALFYRPELARWESIPAVLLALVATCLVASSNYVINEWLDAPKDRLHPKKCNRPAAAGLINGRLAIAEWLILGAVGVGLAWWKSPSLGASALLLWIMGCIYNLPPIRTKDLPYVDVISESFNNPIRLLLGWYALIPDRLPPISLALSYWMLGAFLMAAKRLAELREIGDKKVLGDYRPSFRSYTEGNLLGSMVFYVTTGAIFAGIFIVRYKLELILLTPAVAGFFTAYTALSLAPDSPVQTPEKLYRSRSIMVLSVLNLVLFIVLMFIEIPGLYRVFNVEPAELPALWQLGS